ncbi:MAG: 6-phosphogluconolactonase [Propioniciclava sp.]
MNTVVRYANGPDLVDGAAARLLDRLVALQRETEGNAELCLTGGRIANRIYEGVIEQLDESELDPRRLELWWGDENFVPTEDSRRNAGHTLAILARRLPLTPALTHPMPAADGVVDADAAAASYAKELGDTRFDICLLGMGAEGHVASIFPEHPSFAACTPTVVGVNDAPTPPLERISLTVPTLQQSREVWYLVSGESKASALARAMEGDPAIPAGVVRGTERTLWFLDRSAAAEIPYHECNF